MRSRLKNAHWTTDKLDSFETPIRSIHAGSQPDGVFRKRPGPQRLQPRGARPGKSSGVIGSNSAGKTTLMNTLSGLIIDMRIKEKRKGGERITVYGQHRLQRGGHHRHPAERAGQKGDRPLPGAAPDLSREQCAGKPQNRRVPAQPAEIRKVMDFVFDLFPPLVGPEDTARPGF